MATRSRRSIPARPSQRVAGMKLKPTPVEQEADGPIPVLTPATLKTPEALEEFAAHQADVAVVVAYGLILPRTILDAPPLGCFNLHASLLPRWRGAAPIQRAIMAGDAETGVMVMKMEAGLDTGADRPGRTRGDRPRHDDRRTARRAGAARRRPDGARRWRRWSAAASQLTPQREEGVTYAAKIDKAEARIDWTKPAREVHSHIRGLSPFPGAWFELAIDGEPVRGEGAALRTGQGGAARRAICSTTTSPIACWRRRGPHSRPCSAPAQRPMSAADSCAARRSRRARGSLMPRYKLTIEYDGAPFLRLAAAGRWRHRCRARWRTRSRLLRRDACACTAPAAPMPACTRSDRSRISILRKHCAPARFATA